MGPTYFLDLEKTVLFSFSFLILDTFLSSYDNTNEKIITSISLLFRFSLCVLIQTKYNKHCKYGLEASVMA